MKIGHPQTANLRFRCPDAACRAPLRADLSPRGQTTIDCPSCHKNHPLRIDPTLTCDGQLTRCAVCDGAEFFVRKDFPQRLGMGLVVAFGLTASVLYYYRNIPATYGTLAALVVVDVLIYCFVGTATVCYPCRAEYRRLPADPRYRGFDLATSEKYDVTT